MTVTKKKVGKVTKKKATKKKVTKKKVSGKKPRKLIVKVKPDNPAMAQSTYFAFRSVLINYGQSKTVLRWVLIGITKSFPPGTCDEVAKRVLFDPMTSHLAGSFLKLYKEVTGRDPIWDAI